MEVKFGSVSIGDREASIGLNMPRSTMPLTRAEKTFVGKRLAGIIATDHGNGQPHLEGLDDVNIEIHDVFDVKRLSVTPSDYTCRLTFAKGNVSLKDLGELAQSAGRLTVNSTERIPDDKKGTKEDHAEHELSVVS